MKTVNASKMVGCSSSGSCEGRCGGGSDKDCWCDDNCAETGDCCCDMDTVCYTPTPRDPDCWCHTNDLGPVKNKCCKFPFIYTGRTHHTCVEVEGGDSWCATSLDQDMEYVHGLWGYCSQQCFFDTPTPRSNTTMAVEDVTETSVTDYATSSSVSSSSATADTSTLPSTQPSSTTTSTSAVSTSETPSSSSSHSTPQFTSPTTSYSTTTIAWSKPSDYFLASLPPRHSVVEIPPDLYDPVRVRYYIFTSPNFSCL